MVSAWTFSWWLFHSPPCLYPQKWYAEGRFVPYAEEDGGRELVNLLLRVKAAVHPWIRLNRVVRDIPNQSIIAGNDVTNLR